MATAYGPRNKKIPAWLKLIGVAGGAYLVYDHFKGITNLTVKFRNVNISSVDWLSSKLNLYLDITNPSSASTTIRNILGEVTTTTGKQIGEIDALNINKSIEGNGRTTLEIPLKLSHVSVILELADLYKQFKQSGKVGGLGLDVTYRVDLGMGSFDGKQTIPLL